MIKHDKKDGFSGIKKPSPVVGQKWYNDLSGGCFIFDGNNWVELMFPTQISITNVSIWINHDGHDHVHLYTSLPDPTTKQGEAILTMLMPANTGYEYCCKHFSPLSIKIMMPLQNIKNIY